ncbi:MAG: GNAT family N-acetyltransferase [Candidatus Hodarchaeales archaeon]
MGNMKITYHSDISMFTNLVDSFLQQNEAENNLLFGILSRLKNNIHTYSDTEKPVFITVSKNNKVELVSIRTPPHNQLLSYTDKLNTINFLVEELSKIASDLPGVMGFKAGALRFAQRWVLKNNISYKLDMHERIYQLDKVNKETLGPNHFSLAIPDEKKLLLNYLEAFIKEALPKTSPEEIKRSQKRLELAIENQKVYVLKIKEKIVSMVQRAGETPNGQTINMVYTPPAERRKGYATETVAKVSQKILHEGKKYCFLFTDLTNPTSNKIYQTIGYKPVIDMDVYLFEN